MKKAFLFAITAIMFASCCQRAGEKVPGIDLSDLDTTVSPAQNFYQWANGGWMKKNPLPGEFARYGSFDMLADNNQKLLNDLFAGMCDLNPKAGTDEQKIVDLYKQGLDSVRLNTEGAAPLKKYLDRIYALESKDQVMNLLIDFAKFGGGSFFGMGVSSDLVDSNNQILYFSQAGLGMGSREYYLDPANARLKEGYLRMLETFLTLAGVENPVRAAANALAVEDALAKICWAKEDLRDVEKGYNPMSSQEMFAAYPSFDFAAFCHGLDIEDQPKVVVEQPSFFEGFCKIWDSLELQTIKDYLAADIVNSAANFLSDDFVNANFDFYSRQLSGINDPKPRWKRAMSLPNGFLGEAVGKMYVAKYFPESSKKKVLDIVSNLQKSLGQHIEALDWMGDSTKVAALEKLSSFTVKIGYPDKWKDYSTLAIDPKASYFDNVLAAYKWFAEDNLSRLGKPTDREEWFMSPQTVNAYYNPTTNEICFPAAILQPPFFNADADDAVNYGAIGVVIGHEMTHGFDDQGRLFDKDGNMNCWWTAEDSEAFKAKSQKLVGQYDAVEVLPGVFANGTYSLGENIADQGGVGLAFTAMQLSWNGKHPEPVDSFTAEQRFFIGFAHVWAGNITDEEIARRTRMDVHSLSVNRVNVTLRNFQEFFDAFGIKDGDPMWRPVEERVMIW